MESFLNKVTGPQVCSLIKKRPQHRCFLVNIANFLRAAKTPQVAAFGEHLSKNFGKKFDMFAWLSVLTILAILYYSKS